MIKRILRGLLPGPARRAIGRRVAALRASRLGGLTPAQAFDEIYRKAYWKQGRALSGVGSEGVWADDYCAVVADLVRVHGLRTAVDAGCGDFSIGSRIASLFETYTALDISAFVIARNQKIFGGLKNVSFKASNLIEEPLPQADLVMIRQVLQHLTNAQILAILDNVARSGARFTLIAEEHPGCAFEPNRDLAHHSVLTRLEASSGVDITAPPFSLAATRVARLKRDQDQGDAEPVLALYLVAHEPGSAA
ncbi:Methyltransferase type 12 [Caulobacteraceae bacterium]